MKKTIIGIMIALLATNNIKAADDVQYNGYGSVRLFRIVAMSAVTLVILSVQNVEAQDNMPPKTVNPQEYSPIGPRREPLPGIEAWHECLCGAPTKDNPVVAQSRCVVLADQSLKEKSKGKYKYRECKGNPCESEGICDITRFPSNPLGKWFHPNQ